LFILAIIASMSSLYFILGDNTKYIILLAIASEIASLILIFANLIYSLRALTGGLMLVYVSLYYGIFENMKESVNG
jgi:hypothetical protein